MENGMLQQHPFIDEGYGLYHVLPPQMVSLKDKLPNKDGEPSKWAKETLNALGRIARIQYNRKRKYLTNYKLINGEFVPSEYFDENQEEFDLINQVEKDLEIPSFIRNYDIISQPFNTLVGELSELPDLFDVEGKGDMFESDRMKVKNKMFEEWFTNEVKDRVLGELIQKGIDPNNPNSVQDEEQMQQLQELQSQITKSYSPPEIEQFLKKGFRHKLESWASTELQDQMVRFNVKKAQRTEFSDYLCIAERYRHIYTDAFGLRVESKNPLNVFSHKSPETEYVQDGDYAGFIEFMSLPAVVDRYGYLMGKKQLDKLQKQWRSAYRSDKLGKTMDGRNIDYLNPQGLPYQTSLPTLNRAFNEFAPWMDRIGNTPLVILDETEMSKITGNGDFANYGILTVIHAYWKSQKKIGKLYWINPETGIEEKILVDETAYIPDYIKEVDGSVLFEKEDEINTITWTWVNEVWRGIKIDNYFTNTVLTEPIYIDIRPNDLQFKGELYVYGAKLPIAGQYANNRNTKPTSLVDRLKPFQFFYNVLMNQCFHYLQTEILPFVVMDTKIIPKDKDWGGEDRVEKWIELGQRLGITVADTSLENTKGEGSQGGQYPREVNLDRSSRIAARLQMAAAIRQLALEQVGISQQRLGDVKSTETATGINQSISRSHTQTNSWFESFFDCEREILQMQIDAAQYLQSKKLDIGNNEINSFVTNGTLEINNNDFNLYQLHVYIYKSQEERRKLQYAQKLAEMNTTNTPMSERILMGTSNDIKDIVLKLKETEAKQEAQMQQQQQIEQQKIEASQKQATEQRDFEAQQNQLDREYDLYKAYIQAFGYSNSTEADSDNNGVKDMLEFTKLRNQLSIAVSKNELDANIKTQEMNVKQKGEELKLQNEREKRMHEQILADKAFKQAKVQGDKSK